MKNRQRRSIRRKKDIPIRKKPQSIFYFFLFLPFLIFLATLFNFLFIKPNNPELKKKLPIPKISQVYFSSPLTLLPLSTSVLGLQKFDARDIVKYVNIEREKIGSPPLRIHPLLMKAALMRAEVILKYQNFSHQDPFEDITLVTVLPKVGYRYRYASENIGMGGVSGESFVYGFMNSTSHRENLLNPNLSDTGVAVVSGPYKEYYVNIAVQIFAIPGGIEEYLGYSWEEKENYEKKLADLDTKLNPLVWVANRLLGNKDYTEEKYQKLKRQKEILSKICQVMREEKPLQSEHVAMIMEYNENLN